MKEAIKKPQTRYKHGGYKIKCRFQKKSSLMLIMKNLNKAFSYVENNLIYSDVNMYESLIKVNYINTGSSHISFKRS